jgi:uncharacterized protein YndB with AHSA1/START domain
VAIDSSRIWCWSALTRPDLLAEWFADVVPAEGDMVEFQFGDGDFFVARASMPAPLRRLCWEWRFMRSGGESEINFLISDGESGVVVEVTDRGEYSDDGARELEEGWTDFLGRLKSKLETGQRSRYRWSEAIATSLVTSALIDRLYQALCDIQRWQRGFPGCNIHMRETETGLELEFSRKEWGSQVTHAVITMIERTKGFGAAVLHTGWPDLPSHIQFEERKYAAGCWARTLGEVEAELANGTAYVAPVAPAQ